MVVRIRLQSHQVHLTVLQYYTCMLCNGHKMVKVRYDMRNYILYAQKLTTIGLATDQCRINKPRARSYEQQRSAPDKPHDDDDVMKS